MARRTLVWHLGLADAARPVVPTTLHAHADALAEHGVRVVASPDEARAATHELLRTHRQAGLSREDVEGRWARIADRVWQHKGVSVVSTPDMCAADKDALRLALDPLIGVEVHLVLTAESFSEQVYGGWFAELRSGRSTSWEKYAARVLAPVPEHPQAERFWAGHDLLALLARWGWTFHAHRLHLVAATDARRHWAELLDLVGLGEEQLPAVVPPYADPAGVAVLRRVNRQLEQPLGGAAVDLLTRTEVEERAMPIVPTESLAPMVERWAEELGRGGYDVRGDLTALVHSGEARALPARRDQVTVAVDALAEALAENTRLAALTTSLEAERDRLDRKRRKLKRRLEKVAGN